MMPDSGDAPPARFLQPAGWASPVGYAHGAAAAAGARFITLAGQIGWNPVTASFETDDFGGQARQALANVVALLVEAQAKPQHLVRLTWFVTSRAEYLGARRAIGIAYREVIGVHYPPMSVVVVAGLIEERAKVEIEATAVLPA